MKTEGGRVHELLAITPDDLAVLARFGGGAGVAVWALLWLLKRGDRLQQENIDELRRQRDHYRHRAEQAEAELDRDHGMDDD